MLPEVGSTIVPPGFSFPSRSAASIIASPIRSLFDPPGFMNSSFARISPERPARCGRAARSASWPTRSMHRWVLAGHRRRKPTAAADVGRGGRERSRDEDRNHRQGQHRRRARGVLASRRPRRDRSSEARAATRRTRTWSSSPSRPARSRRRSASVRGSRASRRSTRRTRSPGATSSSSRSPHEVKSIVGGPVAEGVQPQLRDALPPSGEAAGPAVAVLRGRRRRARSDRAADPRRRLRAALRRRPRARTRARGPPRSLDRAVNAGLGQSFYRYAPPGEL